MDVAYVDTETTSLREPHRFGGRRTWEVAIVRVTAAGALVGVTWLQIVDVDLTDADPKSLDVGRFYERWRKSEGHRWDTAEVDIDGATETRVVRDEDAPGKYREIEVPRRLRLRGVTEEAAARIIEELTRGAILAGSNPAFDAANFADILERWQLPAGWYHHHRDIPNIATGWLLGRGALQPFVDDEFLDHIQPGDGEDWTAPAYSTRVLSEACGIPEPADRHSAWADTVWMWRWDRKLRGIELPDVATA